MSKTYAVISSDRVSNPGRPAKMEVVHRDLDAKAAARAAVKVARDVGDSAFVVPMGSRVDNMQMMCSVSLRTRRGGSSKRRFVHCSPMPAFKRLLKSPKKKSRKRR
jgi:hypothetical protein